LCLIKEEQYLIPKNLNLAKQKNHAHKATPHSCAIIGLMNIFPKIEGTLIFGVQIKIMNVIESKEL